MGRGDSFGFFRDIGNGTAPSCDLQPNLANGVLSGSPSAIGALKQLDFDV
jgi:hypothetical protein